MMSEDDYNDRISEEPTEETRDLPAPTVSIPTVADAQEKSLQIFDRLKAAGSREEQHDILREVGLDPDHFDRLVSSVSVPQNVPHNYQEDLITIVAAWLEARGLGNPYIYVTTFTKTLQNWKGMAATTLPDNLYFEVTHDGDENKTYLDVYVKQENVVFDHNLEAPSEQPEETEEPEIVEEAIPQTPLEEAKELLALAVDSTEPEFTESDKEAVNILLIEIDNPGHYESEDVISSRQRLQAAIPAGAFTYPVVKALELLLAEFDTRDEEDGI